MFKIGMVSLGCPKNTVDSEWALGDLAAQGFSLTPNAEEADCLIVNTCGFLESATRESIDTILEMAQYKKDGVCKKLVVTGCLSERYGESLLKEIPEIDHLLGVGQYSQLPSLLSESMNKATVDSERDLTTLPPTFFLSTEHRVLTTPNYSAYLKLGEGCSNKCAFCIIPKLRGQFKSRTPETIVEEARSLVGRGVKELNLISQDTTMYGVDLRMKNGLVTLLRELVKVDGAEWIRLFYCYPTFITEELLDFIAAEPKVCNYIDVPLQHTHDDMLRSMKRQECEAGVRKMISSMRSKAPDIALRTTFITGFPGETEAHFQHTLAFMKEIQFDHVGIFAYSDEEGTTAFDYADKVPPELGAERKDALMEAQREISRKKNEKLIGSVVSVLTEGIDPEEDYIATGRMESQAPDIDGQVILEECDAEAGEIISVKITGADDYDLVGRPV
ncbi:MAG: 30S ribosomal protein S12 methylthiotransferase RimO [Candidatus Nitrohelix vancouverensis]|uniref:Ribosomal protein uS12 methylthiotransferase RimO n=1 Tax=Candidatus Nitrohelix vancouverensis TaxID=2705534 RepID=A0A7T0G2G0_9BACT|nr:MAG: 30S ribosomal protein S12 methylthiotransferase RimO [Candidatus Nitrohelix vancouverensis]